MSSFRLGRRLMRPTARLVGLATTLLLTSIFGTEAKQQPSDIARPAEIVVARQCAYQAVKRLDTPTMPLATLTKSIINACRTEILAAIDEMESRPEVTDISVERFRRNNLDNPDLHGLIENLILVFREELAEH
jgi:hypothetical protein